MQGFSYKDSYLEEGKRILELNILPEKYCNFDCIFCPIGRSPHKVDTQRAFDNIEDSLAELESRIVDTKADLVFINSKGEALVHDKISEIIDFIKGKQKAVRLLSNGYLLGREVYMKIANQCDEVIGELKVITQEDFLKVQRPITEYTLEEYISNMVSFQKQFKGKFILEITIIKGYNDDEASIQKLKSVIRDISPDRLIIARLEEEIFQKKLGISDERFAEISHELQTYKISGI